VEQGRRLSSGDDWLSPLDGLKLRRERGIRTSIERDQLTREQRVLGGGPLAGRDLQVQAPDPELQWSFTEFLHLLLQLLPPTLRAPRPMENRFDNVEH